MYKTYFPVLDAILDALKGNGATNALNAHYLHLTEVQRAENTVNAVAGQFGIDLDEVSDFQGAIYLLASESERQGFINGFRVASLLSRECNEGTSRAAGFIGGLDYPRQLGEDKDAGIFEAFLHRPAPDNSDAHRGEMTYVFNQQEEMYVAVSNSGTKATDQS